MSETPKITYIRGRGLAEVSRLIFAVKDVEIKEEYVNSKAEVDTVKASGKLMFQQLPLIEIDGLCLVESTAQANYLGLKYGLLGGTENEKGRVQMLFAGAKSWMSITPSSNFNTMDPKEELVKTVFSRIKNRYLPAFEKAFSENGTGFLVGSSPTIADCALYDMLSYFEEITEYGDLLAEWPQCKAFLTKFAEIPGVKKYLNSPRRAPPPDKAYMAKVKTIFSL